MSQPEQREEAVFEAALQLPADQRPAYLDQACAGDPDLRRRVELLLGAFERAGGFMKQPATPVSSRTVAVSLPPTEKPGDRIGRYKLLEQIGEGGCGVVYMAEQTESVRRRVALKVIKLGMDTKQVIARFEAERQALALMDHANIAKVLDAGTTETGRPYFVMELVKGIRITDYCDQHHLATPERLGLFTQVCQAIQHAHQKGIIHRDIKPSNILVTLHDGVPVPKVIDFGIAKAMEQPLTEKTVFTAFGQFMGTPAYMSPEQAELSGLDIDTRSDIYALGVLLYELLIGRTPFDAKELLQAGLDEMRRRIRDEEPMRPSTRLSTMAHADLTEVAQQRHSEPAKLTRFIRGDLDWIVMKCLEKDRTRRYETANGLAADIRRHLENEPVVACPPSAGYRFQKLVRRNKLVVAAVSAVVLALVIGLGIAAWQYFEKSKAYNRAVAAEKRAEENATNEARQRQEAVEARKNETQLRQKAEAQELETRRYAYASDMALVQQALEVNALGRARELLDRYRPMPGGSTNEDLRGWEWRYLWQFCKEDEAVPLCKRWSVSSVSFSRDGRLLAVGSDQGDLTVWDTVTRKIMFREATPAFPRKVTFSPLSGLLAYNTQSGVALWDSDTRKQVHSMETGGYVRDLEFCRDGRLFTATTRRPDGVTLWDAESGVAITNFPAVISEFALGNTFSITADGRTFAHVTEAHNVRVVQVESREEWIFPATEELVTGLAFSGDGRMLATGTGFTEGTIKLWDVTTRKLIGSLEGHAAYMRHLKFLPGGKTLASASEDHTIRLWDLETRRPLQFLRGHVGSALYIDVSPDARWVASGGVDGSVFLWDTTSPNKRPPLYRTLTNSAVQGFAFSPDNRVIGAVQNGNLKLYDAATLQPSAGPAFPGRNLTSFAFSPDTRLIVATDAEGHLMAWDTEGQRLRTNFVAHPGAAWLFGKPFVPGGQRLLSLGPSHEVKEWDVNSWREIRHWQISPDVTFDFTGAFSPTEDLIVIGGGWVIELIRLSDPAIRRRLASQQYLGLSKLAISPDGRTLAATSGDGMLGLWNLATEKQTALFRLSKNANGLNSVAFFPDGHRIIAGSDGKQAIIICDLRSGQTVATLDGKSSTFHRVAISPDGQTIAASDLFGLLHVWRAPSWAETEIPEEAPAAFSVSDADVAWPLYHQASALRDQGKVAEAEVKYNEALAAMKNAFGPEDRGVVVTMNALANMLGNDGRLSEAEKLHREAAEIARKLPPDKDHDAFLEWSLGDIGQMLKQQGKLDEAEDFYRQALEVSIRFLTNNPFKTEVNVAGLVDIFRLTGRHGDAEKLFNEVLTPDVLKLPQSAGLLQARSDFYARRGQWKETAGETAGALEAQTDAALAQLRRKFGWRHSLQNHWREAATNFAILMRLHEFATEGIPGPDLWGDSASLDCLLYGPALIELGDITAYEAFRQSLVARNAHATNSVIAERTCKISLLLPAKRELLKALAPLYDVAAHQQADPGWEVEKKNWACVSLALVDYRRGEYSKAARWCQSCIFSPQQLPVRTATVQAILAMSYHQLRQQAEARATLDKASSTIEDGFQPQGAAYAGGPEVVFFDWIFARILLREAVALLGQPSATAK